MTVKYSRVRFTLERHPTRRMYDFGAAYTLVSATATRVDGSIVALAPADFTVTASTIAYSFNNDVQSIVAFADVELVETSAPTAQLDAEQLSALRDYIAEQGTDNIERQAIIDAIDAVLAAVQNIEVEVPPVEAVIPAAQMTALLGAIEAAGIDVKSFLDTELGTAAEDIESAIGVARDAVVADVEMAVGIARDAIVEDVETAVGNAAIDVNAAVNVAKSDVLAAIDGLTDGITAGQLSTLLDAIADGGTSADERAALVAAIQAAIEAEHVDTRQVVTNEGAAIVAAVDTKIDTKTDADVGTISGVISDAKDDTISAVETEHGTTRTAIDSARDAIIEQLPAPAWRNANIAVNAGAGRTMGGHGTYSPQSWTNVHTPVGILHADSGCITVISNANVTGVNRFDANVSIEINRVLVEPGQRIEASWYVADVTRVTTATGKRPSLFDLGVRFYNAAGGSMGDTYIVQNVQPATTNEMRLGGFITVPAGAYGATMICWSKREPLANLGAVYGGAVARRVQFRKPLFAVVTDDSQATLSTWTDGPAGGDSPPGRNTLSNADMLAGVASWNVAPPGNIVVTNDTMLSTLGGEFGYWPDWYKHNSRLVEFRNNSANNNPASGYWQSSALVVWHSDVYDARFTSVVELQLRVRTWQCEARMKVQWFDAAFNVVSTVFVVGSHERPDMSASALAAFTDPDGSTGLMWGFADKPAGAVYARFYLETNTYRATNGAQIIFTKGFLGPAHSFQAAPTSWIPENS